MSKTLENLHEYGRYAILANEESKGMKDSKIEKITKIQIFRLEQEKNSVVCIYSDEK